MKLEEYRHYARECLELAKVVSNPENRKMSLDMAHSCDELARHREGLLASERRLIG
jgi:hypothetical protein